MLRRLCLGCMEDWTRQDDVTVSLCLACQIEHGERVEANRHHYIADRDDEIDWWGITVNDIDSDDLESGFYVANVSGTDHRLQMREVREIIEGPDRGYQFSEYAP